MTCKKGGLVAAYAFAFGSSLGTGLFVMAPTAAFAQSQSAVQSVACDAGSSPSALEEATFGPRLTTGMTGTGEYSVSGNLYHTSKYYSSPSGTQFLQPSIPRWRCAPNGRIRPGDTRLLCSATTSRTSVTGLRSSTTASGSVLRGVPLRRGVLRRPRNSKEPISASASFCPRRASGPSARLCDGASGESCLEYHCKVSLARTSADSLPGSWSPPRIPRPVLSERAR